MKIFLLLGSNLGDKLSYLTSARTAIEKQIGTIIQSSKIYKTSAWGLESQADFYNQVILIESKTPPILVLKIIHQIEAGLDRKRIKKWAERSIDIDILYYDNQIIDSETPDLHIPHLLLHERKFTLIPLVEIAPNFVHPRLGKTNLELVEICQDSLDVRPVN
jgi:2-amino-4-hydroxy-6-hydroxymethyldihydropteridine diphosphokinase